MLENRRKPRSYLMSGVLAELRVLTPLVRLFVIDGVAAECWSLASGRFQCESG
jgi:hypothetical protein